MAFSLCGQSVANVGEQDCDKSRGILKNIFICNGSFAAADYADATTFFNKLVSNAKLGKTATNKVFPVKESQDVVRKSDANKEGTLGLGFKTVLLEGKASYAFKFFGGCDVLKRLRTFNNQTVRIFEYDANGTVWGTKSGTSFIGFQAKLFFSGNEVATGQNVEEGIIDCEVSLISNSEYKDAAYWVSSTGTLFQVGDARPQMDAQLVKVSSTSNAYKYSLGIAGSNLLGIYDVLGTGGQGAAIAALSASFSAKSGAGVPATALAITSIAYNVGSDGLLTVTYDNTAWTAATGNIQLIPPTVAQLDTADVTNLEILSVTHAK